MKRILLYLAVTVVGACSNDAPVDDAAPGSPNALAVPTDRPEIHFVGCSHVEANRCLLEPGADATASVRIWVDVAASTRVHVTVDETPLELSPHPADGGLALRVPLSAPAATLSLQGEEPTWTEPFELRFEWEPPPAAVVAARSLIARGEHNDAIAELQSALPRLEGPDRLRALDLLRRTLYYIGQHQQSFALAEETAALAMTLGRTRDGAAAATSVAFQHIQARRLSEARQWLARTDSMAKDLPEGRVWGGYGRGLIFSATGDLTGALRAFTEAHRWSERLSMFGEQLESLDQHAVVLSELGRADDAEALIRRGVELALTHNATCVQRAQHLGNFGWAQLRLVQARLSDDLPYAVFEEALAALERAGPCPTAGKAANMRVNLALTALAEDEYDTAFDWYSELQATDYPAWLTPWVEEIAARIGLATGRWELHPPSLLSPRPSGDRGLDWSGLVRHARSMAMFGHAKAASDAFAMAEALLDEAIATVGIDAGQELFLARRQESAEGLIESLVRQGKAAEALCRARMARSRALRTVDRAARIASLDPEQRDAWQARAIAFLGIRRAQASEAANDWKFDSAEIERRHRRRAQRLAEATAELDGVLRSPAEVGDVAECPATPPSNAGELSLFTFPSGDSSFVFAASDRRVDVIRVRDLSRSTKRIQSDALLRPFADRIDAASRIRVAAGGWSQTLAFHALPWRTGVLLDVAPVVYELGLPLRRADAAPERSAVVVADPSGDLPYARDEAAAVSQTLAHRGWTVRRHQGVEANRDAFTEAVAEASVLHYAGHGVNRGRTGWESALVLHEGEFGITDILALPRVPTTVVLAGCETGSRTSMALAGNMNLGRAFILAGSNQVVVADSKVDDALARRVGEALHEQLPPDGDAAEALRRVQLSLRAEDPDLPWHEFRVVVP